MNVRCPSCDALYRVDPERVPEKGIRARCAQCPAVISVARPVRDRGAVAPTGYDVPTTQPVADSYSSPHVVEPVIEPAAATLEPEIPADISIEEIPPLPAEPVDYLNDLIPDLPSASVMAEPSPVAEPPVQEVPTSLGGQQPPPEMVEEPPFTVRDTPLEVEAPTVPQAALAPEPVAPSEIEIPAPPSEPAERPQLEVVSGDEAPPESGAPRRYTRPFIRPPAASQPQPAPAAGAPARPTAPVFRPTPGMPLQPPPVPRPTPTARAAPAAPAPTAAPPRQPVEPPVAAAPPPVAPPAEQQPRPVIQPEQQPKRPVNPFLSKDPKQKARRLARALVSDMIVYQPQKRQDALAAGTLKEAFNEEIKKSWEEYVDQVGEEMAKSTDFFKQALNEILAGGNEVF